jgi:hypothetical protein
MNPRGRVYDLAMSAGSLRIEQLLAAIAEAVDDGFYPTSALASTLPKLTHREVVRLRKRALALGLILERRDQQGRTVLALTSEGWRALRAAHPD